MVADGTVGVAFFIRPVPVAAVTVAVAMASLVPAAVVGILLVGSLMLLMSALDGVVDVALYRYAVDWTTFGGFTAADLDGSFRPKRR